MVQFLCRDVIKLMFYKCKISNNHNSVFVKYKNDMTIVRLILSAYIIVSEKNLSENFRTFQLWYSIPILPILSKCFFLIVLSCYCINHVEIYNIIFLQMTTSRTRNYSHAYNARTRQVTRYKSFTSSVYTYTV